MKVKLDDGSYLVAIPFGSVTHAKDLKHAEEIERSVISSMKWGIFLGLLVQIIIVVWVFYGCS